MDNDTKRPQTRRTRIPSPLLCSAITVALLAGCTGTAVPEATVTQTVTASAAPTPSSSPTTTAPTDGASPAGIGDVELGAPYDEAVAAVGAIPAEACPWLASAQADGYTLTLQRPATDEQDPAVIDLIQVSASPVDLESGSTVGPTTPEGIGIGSRLDQALATYPDAVEIESVGDRRYLEIESKPGAGAVFLTYTAGTDIIWAVIATTLEEPPYESCG